MPKQPQIRWRKRDLDELQRAINNFNAKIYRTSKNHPEIADIQPSRARKTDIVPTIATRADFKATLESLRGYSKRGAEKLAPTKTNRRASNWEESETLKKEAIMNKQRERRRKELLSKPVTRGGESTGVTRAEMGQIKEVAVRPSNIKPEKMTQTEWEKKKRAIDKAIDPTFSEFEKHNMRLNYIKGLRNMGYSDDIEALIFEVDIDKFIEIVETDEIGTFDFIYDPLEFKVKEDELRSLWEGVVNGK